MKAVVCDTLPAILGGPAVRGAEFPSWPPQEPEIVAALEDCFRSGQWGRYHGKCSERLIAALSQFHAAAHVVLTCSGTMAGELALRGLNIGPGDEVILAAYDFKANIQNVLAVGATPVLIDVDPVTGQLDVNQVPAAITERTRAVIASHLHGNCVDLAGLRNSLDGSRVAIIEDACQLPGAMIGGLRAGMTGDVGYLSFGGSKLLSAGRGGAVLTNREDVVTRIRRHSFRGNDAFPLSELQAAVVLPQLQTLDLLRQQRQQAVADLCEALSTVAGLRVVCQQPEATSGSHSPDFYKVALEYDASAFAGLSRDAFAAAMQAEGIPLFPAFPGLHQTHARRRFRATGLLSHATRIAAGWLVLHHPFLLAGAEGIGDLLRAVAKIQASADELRQQPGLITSEFVSPWEGGA